MLHVNSSGSPTHKITVLHLVLNGFCEVTSATSQHHGTALYPLRLSGNHSGLHVLFACHVTDTETQIVSDYHTMRKFKESPSRQYLSWVNSSSLKGEVEAAASQVDLSPLSCIIPNKIKPSISHVYPRELFSLAIAHLRFDRIRVNHRRCGLMVGKPNIHSRMDRTCHVPGWRGSYKPVRRFHPTFGGLLHDINRDEEGFGGKGWLRCGRRRRRGS